MGLKLVDAGKYREMQIRLEYKDVQLRCLKENVENMCQMVLDVVDRKRYYVCLDADLLESEKIYATDVRVYENEFVFFVDRKVVAVMNRVTWKDVVIREEKGELKNG